MNRPGLTVEKVQKKQIYSSSVCYTDDLLCTLVLARNLAGIFYWIQVQALS